MKKFITITGTNAWLSQKDSLIEARSAAIKAGYHSDTIVRELTTLIDYTKEKTRAYPEGLMSLGDIDNYLESLGYYLSLPSPKLSYSFIGGIWKGDTNLVAVYNKCFYIRYSSFPVNEVNLTLIKSIQFWYADLEVILEEVSKS